jgi:hypothetical protein
MKPPEDTLSHITEVIAKIYRRPEMYAQTVDGLDSVLFAYHHVWGFIAERSGDVSSDQSDVEPNSMRAPEDVESAIIYWQSVDRLIGIETR